MPSPGTSCSRTSKAAGLLALAWATSTSATTQDPSILPTPPMGFNDWSRFQCNISQQLFVDTADAMASNGMLKAGYNRINIDDCWPKGRAEDGTLQWNETIFPKGLPWLVDYVKQKGFHMGIYSDAGNVTCGKFVGSLDHEAQDAATFRSWGIDYLKLDGCNVYNKTGQTLEERYYELYHRWHEALLQHPLIFSESAPAYFSAYGDTGTNLTDWYTVMDWVPLNGELARHSNDIAEWKYRPDPWNSVMTNYGYEVVVARVQAPGYYNDPDFLVVDEPALTLTEHKAHFALWAILSAPLIVSAYVPGLPQETIDYLTNERLIAINQDKLALQATLASRKTGTIDVLSKSLADGDRAVAVLNNGTSATSYTIPVAHIGWTKDQGCKLEATESWSGNKTTIDACKDGAAIEANLGVHEVVVWRISALSKGGWTPTGAIFNSANLDCLTMSNSSSSAAVVQWTTCDASDSQVWSVGKKGSYIRNLASGMCLSYADGKLSMANCGSDSTTFYYDNTGNIKHPGSGYQCLTEADDGTASLEACMNLDNSQVFEMPSGWQL